MIMNPDEKNYASGPQQARENQGSADRARAYGVTYDELCGEFLAALSHTAKSAALYTLTHPLVTGALGRAYAALGEVLDSSGEPSLTLCFQNDSWVFNERQAPVPALEGENLLQIFKAHGVRGITFETGVRVSELAALCEFLGGTARNLPPGSFGAFLDRRGVKRIHPLEVRYVKENAHVHPEAAAEAAAQQAAVPRPEAVSPAPELTPRPGPAAPPGAPFRRTAAAEVRGPGAGAGSAQEGLPGGLSLGSLLTRLVESAVKDPDERVKMYQDAMKMVKDGMTRQIAEATKQLAAEKEQILSTRSRTEKVLENVAEGKVIVDKEGRILMMNSAAEEISGRRLFEVAGKHVSEHLNPAEHVLTISKDMELLPGRPLTGEVAVSGDAAVSGALRRSMALVEDAEGRVVGAYMTLPEVSKFKEAQRLQDEFLSRVTHDLQSPLSSISSALEMLEEASQDKLGEDEKNFLAISVRNSRRLSEMIRGILDFSKLQAGKVPVHPEPCPLEPILRESVEGLLPWAKTKQIRLTLKLPSGELIAMADHPRIVQVVTNLISNALKSTPSGGAVMVAAARAAAPDQCAIVGVRDTGPGIAKKDLDRIFERFVQLDNGGKREGVGLGLSIVKEFVALHKGRIWVESEQGKGATFYFTLPLASGGVWP